MSGTATRPRRAGVVLVVLAVLTLAGAVIIGLSRGAPTVAPAGPSVGNSERASPVRTDAAAPSASRTLPDGLVTDGGAAVAGGVLVAALRGRVVDPDGVGVAGALVVAESRANDGFSMLDRTAVAQGVARDEVRTSADGSFALVVRDPDALFRLVATSDGFAPAQLAGVTARAPVTLRLSRGAVLALRVVMVGGDAIGGTAIECTRRTFADERSIAVVLARATTTADGRAELGPFAAGVVDVEVVPPVGSRPRRFTFTIADGERVERSVEIVPGDVVRGRVCDAATGMPLAGALVGEGWRIERAVTTDAAGQFVLEHFSRSNQDVGVRCAGYADRVVRVRVGGVLTTAPLAVQLDAGAVVVGRIVADNGPIDGAYVAIAGYERGDREHADVLEWRGAQTGADGRFEIRDLGRGAGWTLVVRRPGFGTAVRDLDAATERFVDVGDVRLERAALVRGRVVDERGQPLVGIRTELRGHDALRGAPAPEDEPRAIDAYVATRAAWTDEAGAFAFPDVAAGSYVVAVGLPGRHGQVVQRAVRVDRPAEFTVDDLELFVGFALEGQVRVDDGGALPTCYVSIDPKDGATTPADAEVGPNGRFYVVGLMRGIYDVTVYPYATEADRAAGRVFRSQVVAGVVAGGPALDIVLSR